MKQKIAIDARETAADRECSMAIGGTHGAASACAGGSYGFGCVFNARQECLIGDMPPSADEGHEDRTLILHWKTRR